MSKSLSLQKKQAIWAKRDQAHNRLPAPWADDIHGSVDVKAILVRRPRWHQSRLYNGKYKHHVVKIQAVVDNRGVPIDIRGLFKGRRHDVRLWRRTRRAIGRGRSRFLG